MPLTLSPIFLANTSVAWGERDGFPCGPKCTRKCMCIIQMCTSICVYTYMYDAYISSHTTEFTCWSITWTAKLKYDGHTFWEASLPRMRVLNGAPVDSTGKHRLLWFQGRPAASGGHVLEALAPASCKHQGSWIWLRLFSASQFPPDQR